jgi:hypothetical protein
MKKKANTAIKRRSFLGLLAGAVAFLLARLPWRRGEARTVARYWRKVKD